MKLFLETNVLLDVLAQREPWVHNSAALLSLVDTGKVQGFVAAHTITTLQFVAPRTDRAKERMRRSVERM